MITAPGTMQTAPAHEAHGNVASNGKVSSNGYTTTIKVNGGELGALRKDTIEQLIDVLKTNALYPVVEQLYGVIRDYHETMGRVSDGTMYFFGSFLKIGHPFEVITNDPDVISRLTKAIEKNKELPDYVEYMDSYYNEVEK